MRTLSRVSMRAALRACTRRSSPGSVDGYRELGHPDGNFDQTLERAIIELLKTPVVDGDVALASKSVAYEFADPRLQSLSSAQRQFLRMGPAQRTPDSGQAARDSPVPGHPIRVATRKFAGTPSYRRMLRLVTVKGGWHLPKGASHLNRTGDVNCC